jgi:hypothetical protein
MLKQVATTPCAKVMALGLTAFAVERVYHRRHAHRHEPFYRRVLAH